jgi:hypothetical protein
MAVAARDRQAGQEGAQEQVAIAATLAPDQRAVDDEGHQHEVEGVHLGERGLLPQRPARAKHEAGGGGNDWSRPQPATDEHGQPDRSGGGDDLEQARSEGDGADRDQAEEVAQQGVQRVAGRVGDAELGGDHLHLRPVADADAGQHRHEVDDAGNHGRGDGRQPDGRRPDSRHVPVHQPSTRRMPTRRR